ncbi:hypothetical protein D3C71_956170 [compost metagenome]
MPICRTRPTPASWRWRAFVKLRLRRCMHYLRMTAVNGMRRCLGSRVGMRCCRMLRRWICGCWGRMRKAWGRLLPSLHHPLRRWSPSLPLGGREALVGRLWRPSTFLAATTLRWRAHLLPMAARSSPTTCIWACARRTSGSALACVTPSPPRRKARSMSSASPCPVCRRSLSAATRVWPGPLPTAISIPPTTPGCLQVRRCTATTKPSPWLVSHRKPWSCARAAGGR